MDTYIPIKFPGGNLGDRHKFMNQRVRDAIKQNVPFEVMKQLRPQSAVDRLFMIDLASKCKNFDYLIENFKDRNMLFVARALKSTWLIADPRYADIINPKYLEDELFPEMMTTAVNKMLHRIYIHLKDEERCYEFYQHYKLMRKVRIAKYFLKNCSKHVILNEIQLFLDDIAPHHLKMICEKCPEVYKKYINVVINNEKAFQNFNSKKTKYFSVLKIILKIEPDIYFEILEQYYDNGRSSHRLSPKATRHIMARHRDRYLLKPELYGGALLHLPTLARCLGEEEARDLLLRLARARYLEPWFTLTYKSAEPLLKRISKEEKSKFVKQIFEDKHFGSVVTEAPHPLPEVPSRDSGEDLFSKSDDWEYAYDYDMDISYCCANKLKKKKCKRMPTLLDKLFDKYRFTTFSKTFTALKKLLQSESSHKNRLMILNVLVSKTSKRSDHIQMLLELVSTRHANEPITLRASFIRSLVRRAAAYRLPEEPWQMFQKMVLQVVFQSEEQVPCDEGLHAILIHDILNDLEIDPDIFNKFIIVFNPLIEYDLSGKEKEKVYQILYSMLLTKSKLGLQERNWNDVLDTVDKILELLKAHKIDLGLCPEVIDIVKRVTENDLEKSKGMLMRLYQTRKCRRTFTKENFLLIQNNASYINALRHDVSLLTDTDKFTDLVTKGELKMDEFLIKLKVYFDDLVQKFKTLVEDKVKSKPGDATSLKLCRALCILKGPAVFPLIKDLYAGRKEDKQLAQRLAANVHMAWSVDGVQGIVHKELGVIVSRNALSVLPAGAVRAQLPALLGGPAPLERLGVALALHRLPSDDVMNVITHGRQSARKRTKRVLLKSFYKYIHLKGESLRLDLWEQMKELMIEFCPYYNGKLWKNLSNSNKVPNVIKVDYCLTILSIQSSAEFKLNKLENLVENLRYLSNKVSDLNEVDTLRVLKPFLEHELDKGGNEEWSYYCIPYIYIKILTRFLLTSKTEAIQNERFNAVALVFIKNMKNAWTYNKNEMLILYFDKFLSNLKYDKVFTSDEFANCLPLFHRVVKEMHALLDVKRCFALYSRVQLTMLYYKTLQYIKKEQPSMLSEQANRAEAAAAVGLVFGRYLAREHRQLVDDYFPTMTFMYADDASDYINRYISGSDKYRKKFRIAVIQGVSYSGEDGSLCFAILMAEKMGFLREMNCSVLQDITNLVANSKDVQTRAFWSVFQCVGSVTFY